MQSVEFKSTAFSLFIFISHASLQILHLLQSFSLNFKFNKLNLFEIEINAPKGQKDLQKNLELNAATKSEIARINGSQMLVEENSLMNFIDVIPERLSAKIKIIKRDINFIFEFLAIIKSFVFEIFLERKFRMS